MRAIAEEGRGVIVLIRDLQTQVGVGLDRPERREQEPAAAQGRRPSAARSRSASARRSCARSGVSDMVLLSNAPPSRYVGLEAFGLRIVGQRRIG